MTKQIIVDTLSKGFHKIIHEDGIFEYVSPKKLEELKAEKEFKFVEVKKEKAVKKEELKDKGSNLDDLDKDALVELAKRFGFEGEVTKEVTKAILKEFITENDK